MTQTYYSSKTYQNPSVQVYLDFFYHTLAWPGWLVRVMKYDYGWFIVFIQEPVIM